MKNKAFSKMLSLILCCTIFAVTILPLFSNRNVRAEERIQYVSDVMLFQAEKLEDAIKDCENNGYIPLNEDLNAGTGEDYVILGYKTTEDREDAITDLSVLQMGIGYEIRSYQDILSTQLGQFQQLAEETFTIIPEFRRNLDKGSPAAKMALKLLNYFYFDEIEYYGEDGYTEAINMKFGDFLLSDYCNQDSENYDPNALASILQRGSGALVNLLYAAFIPAAADYNPNQAYVEGEFTASYEQAPEMQHLALDEITEQMQNEDPVMQLTETTPTETTAPETTETVTTQTEMTNPAESETTTESAAAETEISAEEMSEITAVTKGFTDEIEAEEHTDEAETEESTDETEAEGPTDETEANAEPIETEETTAAPEVSEDDSEEENTDDADTEADIEDEEQEYYFEDYEIILKCDRDNYGNWAERIGKTGIADAYEEGDIDSDMEDAFDAPARLIKRSVQDFAANYLEASAKLEADGIDSMLLEDASDRSLADVAHEVAQRSFSGDHSTDNHELYYIQAYNILDQYEYYDGMSVAEYLVDIGSVSYLDSPEELYPFYPLAAALSNAQTYLMQINGVAPLAMYLTNDSSILSNAKSLFTAIEKSIEGHGRPDGTISVWEGIDRSKYEEKFAETNTTIFKSSTGQLLNTYTGKRDSFRSLTWLEDVISYAQLTSTMVGVVSAAMSAVSAVGVAVGVWTTTVSASACWAFATAGGVGHFLLGGLGTVIMGLSEISIYLTIAVLLVQVGIQLYRTYIYSEDYVEAGFRSEIPGTILDTNDANEYVYYYPALGYGNSGSFKGFSSEYGHGYGDLNGGEGRDDRWSALCWTKSQNAGSPLRLNDSGQCFLVQRDNDIKPSGYEALNCFNEKMPANLNDYVDESDAPTIHLFYITESSMDASLTSWTDQMNTEERYVTEMTMKTGETTEAVLDALREEGWQPITVDLTPNLNDCVTLLGYKSSTAISAAITDLRILPKGADKTAVTKQHVLIGETQNGDRLYTTSNINSGTPILAEFGGISSLHQRKPSYHPMMTFANLSYDLNGLNEVNAEDAETSEQAFLVYRQAQQYLTNLKLGTGRTRAEALRNLTNNGFSFVDRNLTPGSGRFTYLGYKGNRTGDRCITDIRILPAGVDYDTVKDYSKYVAVDILADGSVLYYSTDTQLGDPILADFGVLDSYDDFDGTSRIVSSFGKLAYDFEAKQEYTPSHAVSEAELQNMQKESAAAQQADEAARQAAEENGETFVPEDPDTPETGDKLFLTYSCTRKPQYISAVSIVSYYGNESAAKLELQSQGYTVLNQNLTPDVFRTYTYFGYMTANASSAAQTDIRMAPNYTGQSVLFGGSSYGMAKTNSAKCGVTAQGDGLYQTANQTSGDPILADVIVVRNPADAPAGYEPIMTFGGVPFNFNKCDLDGLSHTSFYWDHLDEVYDDYREKYKPVYLYYRPSVAYLPTDSEGNESVKYVAGITPVISRSLRSETTVFAEKYAANIGSKLTDIDDDLLKGIDYLSDGDFSKSDVSSKFIINYTYNPKRAITDLRSYTAAPDVDTLQLTYGSQAGGCYMVQDPILNLVGMRYTGITYVSARTNYHVLGFSPTHDYIRAAYSQCGEEYDSDHEVTKREDFEEAGYWNSAYYDSDFSTQWESTGLRCKGLYACGPIEGKAALRADELVFTNNTEAYAESSQWKPVVDMRMPNCTAPHNLAHTSTENESNTVYAFIKRSKPVEKQYISSVTVAVADTAAQLKNQKAEGELVKQVNQSNYESCISALLGSCTDEILPRSLSVVFSSKNQTQENAAYRDEWNQMNSVSYSIQDSRNYSSQEQYNDETRTQLRIWGEKYGADSERNSYAASYDLSMIDLEDESGKHVVPWEYRVRDYQDDSSAGKKNVFCAYIGVNRTDNVNEAIRGLLKYQPDNDFAPSKITVGGVAYTKCSSTPIVDINGTYYLYQTTNSAAGEPITGISFDNIAYAPGAITVGATAKESEQPVISESCTYIHCKSDDKRGYVGKIYLGTGSSQNQAAISLLNQGATYVLDLDLDTKDGQYQFIGYSKVTGKNDAVYDVTIITGEQPELQTRVLRSRLGDYTYHYVLIGGVEYLPAVTADGEPLCINTADNAYLYYKPGSSGLKGNETPFAKLGAAERDRVPDNTGLVQPWEYILADGKTKYNLNNRQIGYSDKNAKALTDCRVYLFGLRNPLTGIYTKPGSEITGGHTDAMMTYGEYRLNAS